jgi:RNA polymerase sigma-70 factor (ECF subfamily)
MNETPQAGSSHARFATTRWTVVLDAGERGSDSASTALAELCETYWRPLYAYARHRGYQSAEAQDLTQEFFARLLEKPVLAHASPRRGRFRTFLLTAFQNFAANQYQKQQAAKRGGGRQQLAFDFQDGEHRLACEPQDPRTPESEYERQWALALLQRVLQRLREDYAQKGRGELFAQLKPLLSGSSPDYEQLAGRLRMSPGAVKVAVHRLRRKYGELLTEEVAQTLEDPTELDGEIQHLLDSLSG